MTVPPGQADVIHVFVASRAEAVEWLDAAAGEVAPGGRLWVSYPKSTRTVVYDINRDSLWGLALPRGWHPVSQVALDEEWSAIRLVPNEPGVDYTRPGNINAS